MTLYLKYRPQKISDLDLEEVRSTLEKMVKSGNIPHALLFAGPKGTGKTSAARIIAKVLNCEKNENKLGEPCNECSQCTSIMSGSNVDVIEIDAASHRGIDDIRALRESVKLSPSRARSKVYIIDEAHMLTLEASNALLKTLEEPPSHVYFILATTDPEKLIPTIRSRTTIVNFKKASKDELVDSLAKKAKGENVKAEKKALEIIASFSDGSFRDATKILEQLVNEKIELNEESVKTYLDKISSFDVENFLSLLFKRDLNLILEKIEEASNAGFDAEILIDKVLLKLKEKLLFVVTSNNKKEDLPQESDLITLVEFMLEAKRKMFDLSDFEYLPLQLAVIKWCREEKYEDKEGGDKDEHKVEEIRIALDEARKEENNEVKEKASEVDISYNALEKEDKNKLDVSEMSEEVWREVLLQVKQVNTSIEALLKAAKPLGVDGQTLNLAVYYKFHKERLEEARHRQILESVLGKIFGKPMKVICSLSSPPVIKNKPVSMDDNSKKNDIVDVAKSIFNS
jgi:DNA polymerase-3 subunit gamma/tau